MANVTAGLEMLRPGDLMFGPIGGFVPGVLPVGAGQLLLADRTARLSWRRWWSYRHVGVVVQASRTLGPAIRKASGEYVEFTPESEIIVDTTGGTFYPSGVITAPRLVQAMPSGAEEIDMSYDQHWTPGHVYVRPAYGTVREQAIMTAVHAREYIGTPYSFADYAAILGVHLGIKDGALRHRVTTSGHMICSQLADQALADAGFHVFDDGRLPQDVVPAELYRALMAMPGTRHMRGGTNHAPPLWTEVVDL